MEILIDISRLIALGVLVFMAITLLPKVTVSPRNKVVIAVAVVVSYAFLGVISKAMAKFKTILCGCEPNEFDF